jgi:hypothetical protein
MARKDLAGLAALGALGMMLSKRKGKEGADTSGMDAEMADRANAVSRGRTDLVDTGMSTPEPGAAARPDENYGNEGRRTGPVGVGKVPVRAASPRIGGYMSDSEQIARANTPADTAQADRVRNLAGAFNVPLRGRRDEAGNPYKKGGAVKKMASGGMASSASKRADGIATKGKTRGKMC